MIYRRLADTAAAVRGMAGPSGGGGGGDGRTTAARRQVLAVRSPAQARDRYNPVGPAARCRHCTVSAGDAVPHSVATSRCSNSSWPCGQRAQTDRRTDYRWLSDAKSCRRLVETGGHRPMSDRIMALSRTQILRGGDVGNSRRGSAVRAEIPGGGERFDFSAARLAPSICLANCGA
jgi:hypothetical protein